MRAAAAMVASGLWALAAHAQPDAAVPPPAGQAAPDAGVGPAAPPPPGASDTDASAPPQPPVSAPPGVSPPAAAAPAAPSAPTLPLAQALELEAGDSCLEHEVLVRRVARWLERDHVDARVRVHVRGSDDHQNAVSFAITFQGGHRTERKIHDAPADCDQLHSALALSIALAIDATLLDAQRAQQAEEDVPNDEELLAVESPEPSYFRLALGAFAHATSGLLTDVAPAGSARIEVGFLPWLDLRAGALMSWVDDQRLPGVEGRFDVRLIAGRLDGCVLAALRQLRLLACAGATGGAFRTKGREFSARSITETEPWWAVVGGLELQAEISSWLTLGVSVDLVVPVYQRHIVVLGPDEEPLPPTDRKLTAVGVLAGAGPVFRFF